MLDQQHHDSRCLEVSGSLPFLYPQTPDTNHKLHPQSRSTPPLSKNSNDEAGLYISSYKKLEHRPPTLIKERIDKDYSSIFRSALTSVSKVNRTDVETLRSSVGVWPLSGLVSISSGLVIDETLR